MLARTTERKKEQLGAGAARHLYYRIVHMPKGYPAMKLAPIRSVVMVSLLCFGLAGIVPCASAQTQGAQASTQPEQNVPAHAATQTTAQTSTPSAKLVIKEGTELNLKFAQDLSSKTAQDGDPVNLVLADDLTVDGVTVAKAGAIALGTVTHAKKAGMMGRAGELDMRLEYVVVGSSRMMIRGTKGKEGQGKEGTAVALTVLFGPIGLIKHGKNVEVKQGTPLTAYVDSDFAVPVAQ